MHLIAFPVLSWAPPVMMQMYLKRFPRSKATKVGILAINGALIMEGKLISGYTGQALEQAERILRRKKMDVFMTGNASFPDNWTQMTNPCTPEDAAVIQQQGEKQVLEFGQKFLDETRELYRCGFLNTLWSWLVAWGFGKLGRRALGTFYIADEHCTGCSICANTCPANTIVMENKLPRWKTRCEDCNRCINICPEKAIQVSMPLMIVQLTLHFVLTVWFVIGFLKYAALLIPEPIWLRILVDIPLFLLASVLSGWMTLVPLEYVFRISMKISAVRRLATKSMTKSFRRYTAPGYKPWK
jgi:Pyruvate/2-oxoacid:ferredoxin oxidoreductase delta subunit